jgi:hypothetical protein
MELPKLYRVCWVKLYWLTDTCEGGEHVQRDGYYHLKARRALKSDKSWFWQLDKWDAEQCKYELSLVDDLAPEDMFEGFIYKEPFPFDERNLGYVWNRPTIKQQKNQEWLEQSIPF